MIKANSNFKVTKILLLTSFFVIMIISIIHDLILNKAPSIMENNFVSVSLNVVVLFIGIHFFAFKKDWVKDICEMMENHCRNKPTFYKKWLETNKTETYNAVMVQIISVLCVLIGLAGIFKVVLQ